MILIIIAFLRELLGSGTVTLPGFGELHIIPQAFYEMGYKNNGLMILPPMALITVGVIIWLQRHRNRELIEKH